MSSSFASPELMLSEAGELYNEGQYKTAITLIQTALSMRPKDVTPFYMGLGKCYLGHIETLGAGDKPEINKCYCNAFEAYKRVVALKPDFGTAVYLMGNSAYGAGKFAEAEIAFEKTISLDGEDDTALAFLAMCYLQLEKFSGHEDVFLKASQIDESNEFLDDPMRAEIFYGLARAIEDTPKNDSEKTGDYARIESALQRSLELLPGSVFYILELSEFYLRNLHHPDMVCAPDNAFTKSLNKAYYYADLIIKHHPKDHPCEDLSRAEALIAETARIHEGSKRAAQKLLNSIYSKPDELTP